MLPALTFPYFDPQSRTYQRATTQPVTVTVLPGRSRELVVSGATEPTRPLVNATPSVEDRHVLPPPLHGAGGSAAPLAWSWPLLLGGLLLGTLGGLVERLRARPRRAPHRGRALATAVLAKDLNAIARCVHALRPDLDHASHRAADALEGAIDRARFGNGEVGELGPLAEPLVGIP